MKLKTTYALLPGVLCGLAMLTATNGCVTRRGVDFGQWARAGERIEVVRVYAERPETVFNAGDRILILPPTGRTIPEDIRLRYLENTVREIQYARPLQPVRIEDRREFSAFLGDANLMAAQGIFNVDEAARIGALLNVPFVLCTHVGTWRPYVPQVVTLDMTLIHVPDGKRIADLRATFNAAEQQVVLALDEYLQARRAKPYDAQSLENMLRSPSEFGAFVTARCVQKLFASFGQADGKIEKAE